MNSGHVSIGAALEDPRPPTGDSRRSCDSRSRLLIASNRLPSGEPGAGGLTSGLLDALGDDRAVWFGWCGGRAPCSGGPSAGTGNLEMTAMSFTSATHDRFYRGFSNSVLWPLCHGMPERVRRTPGDYDAYLRINRQFATTIRQHLRSDDRLWVHDYHLLPLGRHLRRQGAGHSVGFFFHVPVPSRADLECVPECLSAVESIGDYDVIGVQTAADAARLRQLAVGSKTRIVVAPVGIDAKNVRLASLAPSICSGISWVGTHSRLLVGVDRLDYTKGLLERFRALDVLLRDFPRYRSKIMLLQIVVPARRGAAGYDRLLTDVRALSERINKRWSTEGWQPLRLYEQALPRRDVASLLRRADVGLVTPVRDGMNLVAKEFVAAQDSQDPGVLVLSRQAGAAESLTQALLVDAGDPAAIARTIDGALRLPLTQRRSAHARLLATVRRQSAAWWHQRLDSSLKSVSRVHRVAL